MKNSPIEAIRIVWKSMAKYTTSRTIQNKLKNEGLRWRTVFLWQPTTCTLSREVFPRKETPDSKMDRSGDESSPRSVARPISADDFVCYHPIWLIWGTPKISFVETRRCQCSHDGFAVFLFPVNCFATKQNFSVPVKECAIFRISRTSGELLIRV